jgi:hypothetical protein
MTEHKYKDERGHTWNLYAIEFDSPDGDFTVTVWAISDSHAQLQLDALKETGKLLGQIEKIMPRRLD